MTFKHKINIYQEQIALIIGDNNISEIITQKLQEYGCNAMLVSDLPKKGIFDYIFIFESKDRILASQKLLKPDGKLIFIDAENEILENFSYPKNVKILKISPYQNYEMSYLSEKILKTLFSFSSQYNDIRKKTIPKMKFTTKIPVHNRDNEIDKQTPLSNSEKENIHIASNKHCNPPIIYKNYNKYLFFLTSLIGLFLIIPTIVVIYFFISIKTDFEAIGNGINISDWDKVEKNLISSKYKITLSSNLYQKTKPNIPWIKDIRQIRSLETTLKSSEKFIQVSADTISFLKGYSDSSSDVIFNDLIIGNKYENVIGTVNSLISSSEMLKTNISDIELPYFPKDNVMRLLDISLDTLSNTQKILPIIRKIFSSSKFTRYLLLFQNPMELRPTGGFIGSIGILEIENYKVKDFKISDVYEIDGQLKGHVEPPQAFRKYFDQPNFFLRDSNYDPDFARSALQAIWFYEKITNKKIDGVFALNLFLLQDLLKEIGSIKLSDFNNEEITSENIFLKSQLIKSNFFEGSSQKKNFLSSLNNSIILNLASKNNFSKLNFFNIIFKNLEEKNILLFFTDSEMQKKIEEAGWSGRILRVSCLNSDCYSDYLSVIETNFGVNKANYLVKKSVTIEKKLTTAKQLLTTLTLTYVNNDIPNILQGGKYKNYLRILIPFNSKIISVFINNQPVNNSQIDKEKYTDDKNSYGILMEIPQNSTTVIKFSYILPYLVSENLSSYQFYFQKQPGDKTSPLIISYMYPNLYELKPMNFRSYTSNPNEIYYTTDTSVDRVFSLQLK